MKILILLLTLLFLGINIKSIFIGIFACIIYNGISEILSDNTEESSDNDNE
jgi:hypothetical protein